MLLMRVNKIKSPSLAEFATFAALRIANSFDAEPYLSKDPMFLKTLRQSQSYLGTSVGIHGQPNKCILLNTV